MAEPAEFEALCRHALIQLGEADAADAKSMPLNLLARMYGPRTVQRVRATVCWIAMLLATNQLRAIHVDNGMREKSRELSQLAAGWVTNHHSILHYGRLAIPDLTDGPQLRRYYENLHGLQGLLMDPVLAPTVGSAYPAQLIERLFELSVLLEILTQQHGAGTFRPNTQADLWYPRLTMPDLKQLTGLLERILAVQYRWVAAFPTYSLFEELDTLDALMARLLAYANSASPGTRRHLMIDRGDLHVTVESVYIEQVS